MRHILHLLRILLKKQQGVSTKKYGFRASFKSILKNCNIEKREKRTKLFLFKIFTSVKFVPVWKLSVDLLSVVPSTELLKYSNNLTHHPFSFIFYNFINIKTHLHN